MTTRERVHFVVKEFVDGTPWLMLEPYDKTLPCIGDGFLGLDLSEGTTYEQAERLAQNLNEPVVSVSHTDLRPFR